MSVKVGLLLSFAAALIFTAPSARAQADAGEVCLESLEDLVRDYGFDVGEVPTFDDARFNRILVYSRRAADKAVRFAERGRLENSAWWLTRAIASAESATKVGEAAGISGTGFSDDLAGFGSFILLSLFDDLIAETVGVAPMWATAHLMDISAEAHDLSQGGKYTRAARRAAHGITWALWLL